MRRTIVLVLALLGVIVPPSFARKVTISTMPEASSIQFYRGTEYLGATDKSGKLTVDLKAETSDGVQKELEGITAADAQIDPRTRLSFERWWGGIAGATALLKTERLVGWTFRDLDGRPVDPKLVESLVIKASTGDERTYDHSKPDALITEKHWLMSQRVVPLGGDLEIKNLYYSVQKAMILGANAVNSSQQRFEPTFSLDNSFELSFFPLEIQGIDALFGRPAGDYALLYYPDGSVRKIPLVDGVARFKALARGTYEVTIKGKGWAFKTPVSVSKPQIAEFKMVTHMNLALVFGVLALIAIGLIWVGRPHVFKPSTHRSAWTRRGSRVGPAGAESIRGDVITATDVSEPSKHVADAADGPQPEPSLEIAGDHPSDDAIDIALSRHSGHSPDAPAVATRPRRARPRRTPEATPAGDREE